MPGKDVTWKGDGGQADGYLAAPAGSWGPGVIVLQEWWGLVPHIRSVADRFAAEGFFALAPDLYHGESARGPDEAGRLMMALDIDRAERDLRGAVAHLRAQPGVAGSKVGVVGFCMGGQLALFAASKNADVGACVDFYGIHPKVTLDAKELKAAVLGVFAGQDAYVTPEQGRALAAEVKAAGGSMEVLVYERANHAFFNDTRPDVHDPAAARDAWAKTLDFFRKHLTP